MADGLAKETLSGGRLLRIRLASPPGNVLDRKLIGALDAALAEASEDEALCAVLLSHEGDHFSYGASVPEHLPGEVETMIPAFHKLARRLVELPVPLLAAVRGRCLGGGLELVLPAARVFCAPGAVLGQPEISLAVFAPVASALLPERVGRAAAEDLLLTGRTVKAEAAIEMGLVDVVSEDPEQGAIAYAEKNLTGKSAFALRLALRAARAELVSRFAHAIEAVEPLYLETLMSGADPLEGLNAFLEKRRPNWSDR